MILYFVIFITGIIVGILIRYLFIRKKTESIEYKLKLRIEELKRKEQELLLEAEKKAFELLESAKKEKEEILKDLKIREERIIKKEEFLEKKEREIEEEKERYKKLIQEIEDKEKEYLGLKEEYENKLQNIAEISKEKALEILFQQIEKENENILMKRISKLLNNQREEIEKKAREIILEVLPKYSRSVASEFNITVVNLPSEEMKGRIIGKEGRNIRYFEKLAGVQLIIDETPELVTISSFDPVRREIARLALEKLIKDGRIQPATIEEAILSAKNQVEEEIKKAGKSAAEELNIFDLPEDILQLMGRLKYRYSYGQNVLQHSIEVAIFSRMIAE